MLDNIRGPLLILLGVIIYGIAIYNSVQSLSFSETPVEVCRSKNHNVYHIFSNDSTKLYKDKGNMEKCQQLLSLRRRRAGVYCTVFQLFCVFEIFPQ